MYEREIERKKSVHYESGRKKRMKERKKTEKKEKQRVTWKEGLRLRQSRKPPPKTSLLPVFCQAGRCAKMKMKVWAENSWAAHIA